MAVALAAVSQPAQGATLPPVNLAWNQNPESDIAGYEVKYGTVSGSYTNTVSAGLNTSTSVSGLTEGVTYYFVVLAFNDDGLRSDPSSQISYTGTNPTPNQAPQSTISGPSSNTSITTGQSVSFSGNGSDPDGNTPLTYRWDFGSGSGISDSTSRNPGSRQFNNPGTYLVTFTVTDSEGLVDPSPATRTITVSAPNQAPASTISSPSGNTTITVGQSVSFSGSGSDSDGDTPLAYRWDFGNGSGISDSTSRNPGSRQFNNAGTYTVTFTVTDSQGLADSTPATRTITVMPPVVVNQAPQSTISGPSSDSNITVGESVSFAGSGSDPDGNTPLTYRWDFGNGSGIANSTSRNPGSRQFNNEGTYVVAFIVTDSLGLADPTPATRTITVSPANQAPQSTISSPSSNITITAGQSVDFAGRGSDPDGNTPLSYSWALASTSGTTSSTDQNPGLVPFETAGTYEVSLTVTDSKGLADPTPATRTITVNPPVVANQAPQSTISSPSSNVSITVGGTLNFSGSGSDPDGDTPLTYRWNFGSGSGFAESTSQNPGNRRFNNAGTFVVTLTVTDSKGLADPTPATRTIIVNPPVVANQAPQSTISAPSSNVSITAGGVIYFAGSGSDPDGNTPLSYRWNFGSGSGIANSSEQNPGTRIFNTAGSYVVTLTASDSLGLPDPTPATRTITVLAAPPTGNQAPNSTITTPSSNVIITAGESVNFSGSGNDPDDNTPLSYRWDLASSFGNSISVLQSPGSVSFANPGTYEISLTVTDSNGLADPTPAMRTITVLAAPPSVNEAPSSTISSPSSNVTINAGQSVNIAGSGNDPDSNTALSYRWRLTSQFGASNSILQSPGPVAFKTPGTYALSLIVSDAKGLADPTPATRTITVLAAQSTVNVAPSSTITSPSSNVTITAGQSVNITGNGNDSDGNTPLSYQWSVASDSGTTNSAKQNPGPVEFKTPGTYLVSLTVTDSKGLADPSPAQRTITVIAAPTTGNRAPNSNISAPSSNVTIIAGQSVNFTGNGTDPDGNTPLTYRWDLASGTGISTSTSQNPGSVEFNTAGTFQVVLTVTDSKGLSDPTPATRTVTVTAPVPPTVPSENKAPSSTISSPSSNVSITAGESIIFSGSGNDPDGNNPLSYRWDFGSGSGIANSTTQNPGAKQFDTPGTYEVSLTVTDAKGLADPTPAKISVTVTETPESIPGLDGWIASPDSSVTISAGDSVWFSGYGINNYSWGSMSYRWNFGAGSGIPDSTEKRPRNQQFNIPGTYKVTFTVINSNGVADPSPATVTVVVSGNASN